MAVRLTFEFLGEAQLDRSLARFSAQAAADARPLWNVLADRFGVLERQQFASEGRFSGGWPALSQAYAAWKARAYPGKPILERDGDLKRSLTVRPFGIEELREHDMLIGSDVAHGRFHQQGDGLPRRRPVEFPEGERRTWVRLMQRFIIYGEV